MRSCGCPLGRGNDVCHEVSVHPVDGACVHVCHLEQRGDLWISGASIDQNHVSHPPVAAVLNDHGHAWLHVQENRIRLGRCNGAWAVNRYTPLASTAVLVQAGVLRQRRSPEENKRLWQTVRTTGASCPCRHEGSAFRWESRTTWPPPAPMVSRGPSGLFLTPFKNQQKFL